MTKQNGFNYIWPTLFGSFYNPEHQKIKNQLIAFFEKYKKIIPLVEKVVKI